MKRNGHSLFEMMVVMAVLAGMVAIAFPLLKSPLNKMHLKAAAQEVSTELSKGRMKAMQSGIPQVFQIQPHTGKFQTAPMGEPSIEEELLESERSPLNQKSDNVVVERELPSGVCFDMPTTEENEDEDEQTQSEWTNVAVFYPNGDSKGSPISLADDLDDMHIDVKLNSLTGSSKIGDVYREVENDNRE